MPETSPISSVTDPILVICSSFAVSSSVLATWRTIPISCIRRLLLSSVLHFVLDDLDLAGRRVGRHFGKLVLTADHVGGGGNIPAQMDGVKLASCGAKTAADAAVEIHEGSAAAKAAGRFCFDLLFREGKAQIRKGPSGIAGLLSGHLPFGIVKGLDDGFLFVQLDKLPLVPGYGLGLSGMYIAVHALAGLFAVRDGIDGKAGPVGDVAADEDARLSCLEGQGIMFDCAVRIQFDLCALQEVSPEGGLADGFQNIFAGDGDGLLFLIPGRENMTFSEDGDTFLKDDAGDFAIFRQDLFGSPPVQDTDSFFSGLTFRSMRNMIR